MFYIKNNKLWKQSINSDGHQFHQHEQNKQSPLMLTQLTEHKKDHDIWWWKCRSWIGTGTKNVTGLNSCHGIDILNK